MTPILRTILLQVLIAGAGFVLTALAYLALLRQDDAGIRSAMEFRADWRASDLAWKLENLGQSVLAVAAAISSDPDLTIERIRRMDAKPLAGQEAILAFGWLPRVPKEARNRFEEAIRSAGNPDFRISDNLGGRLVPAAEREVYFPIAHAWTFDSQASGLGFDVLADPAVRGAAEAARDHGWAMATSPTRSPITGRLTMVPIAPVYRGGSAATVEERRDRLAGYVIARVQLIGALNRAIANTPLMPESLYVFNTQTIDGSAIPFAEYEGNSAGFGSRGDAVDISRLDGLVLVRSMKIMGTDWAVAFHFPSSMLAGERSVGLQGMILAGVLVTAAFMLIFWRESLQAVRSHRLVAIRTADLNREIDERRRIEQTSTAIIEQSPFAIIGVRPDRRVMLWNRAAERIFGYSATEAIGHPYALVPPDGQAEFDKIIDRVSSGERLVDVEVRRVRKDGSLIDIVFSGAPLYDADDALQGLIFVLQDVTERKAIEAQLRQLQKMEAIGQLSGGIAHDFNNMLGAIIGSLENATDEKKDVARIHELIENVIEIAVRGGQLVQRLLAFARRQMLAPKLVDVAAVVDGMVPLLKRTIGESIEIKGVHDAAVWSVVADPSQLESAILNLAINARDAMPSGGSLTITATNVTVDADMAPIYPDLKQGDYVLISVADTGTGMTPEVVSRAFEPFFTTKAVDKGTGLGLAMVYGFLRQSDGTAKIYSEIGHGTTIHLYLPRAQETGRPQTATAEAEAPRGTERVLLVEDNAEVREVASVMLMNLGYRVVTANDGAEAIRLIERGDEFDLLFSDAIMPGMSGIELAKEVRRRWPGMPMLLTSGFASPVAVRDEVKAEGIAFLAKPYRRTTLAAKIREIIDAGA
ncbi:MAG: CHASE domain-containing protein [Rhodospirillaceae bacterium]|nr:CHASE domain-containing protein [Rhodospirillaceae bacterium]